MILKKEAPSPLKERGKKKKEGRKPLLDAPHLD